MSFLQRLFGGGNPEENDPSIKFGRYSDAFKPDAKYDAWDTSLSKFEKAEYLDAYRDFIKYLTDDSQQNVKSWEEDGTLYFELLQGSKKITGSVGEKLVKAEAKVATAKTLSIGFLRRMMEQNFSLKYGRYALDDDDNLTLVFDSYLLDGSPFKLYYALKEIAVHADKQDDLLLSEFDMLKPINTGHVGALPDDEKAVKFAFLQQRISEVLHDIDVGKLNGDQYPGGIGYLLLDLVYRLDYLVHPEGTTTEAFERIHRLYFAKDGKSAIEKNLAVRKELDKILEKKEEELNSELYTVSSTFGITSPSNHQQLVSLIDGEIHNMDWYVDNKHENVALAIPGHIAGYCLFNYAFPPPVQDLLHLYYRISEPRYFAKLGFSTQYYDPESKELDKRAIRNAMDRIESRHKSKYHKLDFDFSELNFDRLVSFGKSYFLMIRALDLTKKS